MILPLEILTEIFKYIKDYRTLFSCVLVNKQWHIINIPVLWRNSFYSQNSIKILINCILVQNEDILKDNNIQLKEFELLKKPPLYNYAIFATELNLRDINYKLQKFINNNSNNIIIINHLKKLLVNYILDYSFIKIYKYIYDSANNELVITHPRFSTCFQNLNILEYNLYYCGHRLLDNLVKVGCKNIQVLKMWGIYYYHQHNSITQLIKSQNQIKELMLYSSGSMDLPTYLSDAILIHSKSLHYYENHGNNSLNCSLLPKLKNLKHLTLSNYCDDGNIKHFNTTSFPNIEYVDLNFYTTSFLLDLIDFIKINGNNLKILKINGSPNDMEFLGELIESIGEKCQKLEHLEIFYTNNVNQQQLIELFNGCRNLKYIKFSTPCGERLFGDEIFVALNQTLPKNLKTIVFEDPFSISEGSLDNLINNWKGPKPFKIKSLNGCTTFLKQIKKYQDLGFLIK